ncbi:MAG: hypothetical protein ACJ8BF_04635, partial [Gemmatimonadales bacterium]
QAIRNQRGVALFVALLLLTVLATLSVGAIMLSGNASLLGKYHAKDAEMRAAADAGLEWARDTINGTPGILPATSFQILQFEQPVRDAGGTVIPGFTRSVFAGRSGTTTGQFGVFASVISRIDDAAGRAVVVRRAELAQESFARFARFDDITISSVVFASGIQVFGPIHTNGILYVGSSPGNPAIFNGVATTSATIQSAANGTFRQGYKTGVPRINLPTPADLATLQGYATTAKLAVTGGALGNAVYDPRTRIEFVPLDINGDGDFADENEGFFRVYRGKDDAPNTLDYVTARKWNPGSANDPNSSSPNCGDVAGAPLRFVPAAGHTAGGPAGHNHNANATTNQRWSLATAASRRCYLGGDPRLTNGWQATTLPPYDYGAWVPWPGYGGGAAPAAIANATIHPSFGGGPVGADMAQYLWPISRPFNPDFNGVIYVDGSVGISGVVRGQVTVAASGNVLLADDLIYVTAPGSVPDCYQNVNAWADMLGVLTAQFFVIEDNNVNSPFLVNGAYAKGHDETPDETIHGAVLTLNSVMSEALGAGSTNSEVCAGAPIGRGCFNMVGAAIQGRNAGRMQGGTGWNPQWTYDRCDAIKPPPYFPTTGRYYKNRYYEIDPVGFSVAGWFAANQ